MAKMNARVKFRTFKNANMVVYALNLVRAYNSVFSLIYKKCVKMKEKIK